VSLKTRALRLGELLEQNMGESQPFLPRRDELAWARIIVLATVTRMQQELTLNSNIPELNKPVYIIQNINQIKKNHCTDQRHAKIALKDSKPNFPYLYIEHQKQTDLS